MSNWTFIYQQIEFRFMFHQLGSYLPFMSADIIASIALASSLATVEHMPTGSQAV